MGACTNSAYQNQYNLNGNYAPIASYELLSSAVEAAQKIGVRYKVGNLLSSDIFYHADPNFNQGWYKMGVLGVEMEAAALYCNAARAKKKALCICSVSDSLVDPGINLDADTRRTAFTKMMEIALEIAEE
jgi:purine-nucleoside phosphorylase